MRKGHKVTLDEVASRHHEIEPHRRKFRPYWFEHKFSFTHFWHCKIPFYRPRLVKTKANKAPFRPQAPERAGLRPAGLWDALTFQNPRRWRLGYTGDGHYYPRWRHNDLWLYLRKIEMEQDRRDAR